MSKFGAKAMKKSLLFFKTLKQTKDFQWSAKCQTAFDQLCKYLASPPLLTRPTAGEMLYLYVAISPMAISLVLVYEDRVQWPFYYTSRTPKHRDPVSKAKVAYTIVISTQLLQSYFQAHSVVLTNQPLRPVIQKVDAPERLVKWVVKLEKFDIDYQPRPTIKAQPLVDFLMECTLP